MEPESEIEKAINHILRSVSSSGFDVYVSHILDVMDDMSDTLNDLSQHYGSRQKLSPDDMDYLVAEVKTYRQFMMIANLMRHGQPLSFCEETKPVAENFDIWQRKLRYLESLLELSAQDQFMATDKYMISIRTNIWPKNSIGYEAYEEFQKIRERFISPHSDTSKEVDFSPTRMHCKMYLN